MTATLIPPRSTPEPDSPAPVEPAPSLPRAVWAAVVVLVWIAVWALT